MSLAPGLCPISGASLLSLHWHLGSLAPPGANDGERNLSGWRPSQCGDLRGAAHTQRRHRPGILQAPTPLPSPTPPSHEALLEHDRMPIKALPPNKAPVPSAMSHGVAVSVSPGLVTVFPTCGLPSVFQQHLLPRPAQRSRGGRPAPSGSGHEGFACLWLGNFWTHLQGKWKRF